MSESTPRMSAEAKRAYLARLLQAQENHTLDTPLSFAQERLWFLQQIDGDSAAYHISRVFFIHGALNVAALRESLATVVRRHECLRAQVINRLGHPRQVILPHLAVALPVHELPAHTTTHSATARRAAMLHLAAAASQQPFDLTQAPLWRVHLWRLDAQTHVLLLVMHHIITDGWSMAVLLDELSAGYQAAAAMTPLTLAELPVHYSDFVRWERHQARRETQNRALHHWATRLAGAPLLELPGDRPRPAVNSQHGAVQTFQLDAELTAALRSFQQAHQVTPYMTALAGWLVLLQRLTHQDDIVVGSPVANRADPRLAGVLGFVANTVVLRADLRANSTVRDLMHQVRTLVADAMSHQELPFERLVEALQPERSLSHTPLFQVMFAYQTTPLPALRLPGLDIEAVRLHGGRARFDLTLEMWEEGGTIHGALEYSTDLFDAETVRRWLRHYRVLLHALVTQPTRRILDLPVLTAAERQQLIVTWNATTTRYLRAQSITALFTEQAARQPDALALVTAAETITYRELNRRANQVARRLQRLGVGPDVLVGLCVERGVARMVAVLGILKAGGAYLPLDPAYPAARVQFMLADTAAPVVITTIAQRSLLTGYAGTVIEIDTVPAGGDDSDICVAVDPEHLAYVIYTSGSTGRPKGVWVPHRGVVNLLADFDRRQAPASGDAWSTWTSVSFDVSVYEIFGALTSGGTLHLPDEDVRADTAAFIEWLAAHRIHSAYLPPFMVRDFAAWLHQPGHTSHLRRLLVGVEPIPDQVLKDIGAAVPGLTIINGYGPTETSICATAITVGDAPARPGHTPIGRPVANVQVYIVDRQLQLVPVGVAGELLIGGEGLARGYVQRPALTAERFIPDPFSAVPGTRLYRTGDRVRYLVDGCIEFLGRMDDQVKLRGFRIEPGEIAAVLDTHAAVRESIVVARDDALGNKRLIAYVVPLQECTPIELRQHLKDRLPDHMVPTTYAFLPNLPLTPQGKVDRRALPVPDTTPAGADFIAPRSSLEQTIAAVWEEVLQRSPIGVNDDFFDLGGHSLLMTQVFARLRRRVAVDLPLRTLFEAPTIAALASQMEQRVADLATLTDQPVTMAPGMTAAVPHTHGGDSTVEMDEGTL